MTIWRERTAWEATDAGLIKDRPRLSDLLGDESAQDLIEYALILAFMAMGAVATLNGLASSIASFFGSLGTTLTTSV